MLPTEIRAIFPLDEDKSQPATVRWMTCFYSQGRDTDGAETLELRRCGMILEPPDLSAQVKQIIYFI